MGIIARSSSVETAINVLASEAGVPFDSDAGVGTYYFSSHANAQELFILDEE